MVKSQFLVIFILLIISQAASLSFNFSSFKQQDEAQLILSDYSRVFRDAIQVTPDAIGEDLSNKSGRAFYYKPFTIWNSNNKSQTASFNTTFVLRINPQTPAGAGEGSAFILTGDTTLPLDSYGEWLGIVNSTTNGTSQSPILAVEFDVRHNFPQDGPDNHVGVNINGVYSIIQVGLDPFGINISSSSDVTVRLEYADDVISVFGSMNGTNEQDMKLLLTSPPLNLSSFLPDKVYVGFSASTSNFTELNCIRAWEFNGVDIEEGDHDLWWVVAITVPSGLILIGGVAFFLFWQRKRMRDKAEDAYPRIEDQIQSSSTSPKKFKLKEIRKATGNFNEQNKLGEGGFGTVYKGVLNGNKEIAVKRVSKNSSQGKQEFIAEVTTIGSLHHKNLVKLIGWCYEGRELLLVYEFMPKGSLDRYLFGNDKGCNMTRGCPNLRWETRHGVIHGVAQALDYLHNGCEKKVCSLKFSLLLFDVRF